MRGVSGWAPQVSFVLEFYKDLDFLADYKPTVSQCYQFTGGMDASASQWVSWWAGRGVDCAFPSFLSPSALKSEHPIRAWLVCHSHPQQFQGLGEQFQDSPYLFVSSLCLGKFASSSPVSVLPDHFLSLNFQSQPDLNSGEGPAGDVASWAESLGFLTQQG
jgi:hypothetical protein